ncbi:MAG: DUF2911 domain-containing protein [Cyclobacteriaceae bacterium]|nr:DUF2911 domain-containing protein [Cyclobacteriaceae bacterium]
MKRVIIVVGILVVVVIGMLVARRMHTKSFSPEAYAEFGEVLSVQYCSPYKNGREIFGGLVPFDSVWRTGANEATVFSTNQDIIFGGIALAKGKYSLWTIPGKDRWQVILNSEYGQWGDDWRTGVANKDPGRDVLEVEVPMITTDKVFEQFTITFEKTVDGADMVLMWDQTQIVVPIEF